MVGFFVIFASLATLKVAPCSAVAAAAADNTSYFNFSKFDMDRIKVFDQVLYENYVRNFQNRFRNQLPSDVVEEGVLWGYMQASLKFNPDRGKFPSFFWMTTYSALISAARSPRWKKEQTVKVPEIFDIVEDLQTSHHQLKRAEEREAKQKILREALDSIQPRFKEILELRYIRGFTMTKVAIILNIPLGTVKSTSHWALKALKERVRELTSSPGICDLEAP
jgi:RNA polymerase sigma factor (sigma-70 family)